MNTLLGAYLTGAGVGLLAGILLVLAAWGYALDQQRPRTTRPAPSLEEGPTDLLPRIHHLDDARRAHRKESYL